MELTYKKVSEDFKECSLMLPPAFRVRCRWAASYAVFIDNGWYWRCVDHKDVVSLNEDGTVRERGKFSEFYPSIK
jgi:hypothetical protein